MTNTNRKKVEFYKIRTLSERLSVSVDFMQSNMKVIFKNVFKLALPLALVQGYFMNNYMDNALSLSGSFGGDYSESSFLLNALGLVFISVLGSVLVYAMIANIFVLYEKDELSKQTQISDMKKMAVFAWRSFLVMLLIGIIFIVAAFLIGITQSVGLIIILFFAIFACLPSLCLVIYSVYFEEDLSIFECIQKGINMGFRNWGTTFLIAMISGILSSILQYIFIIPTYLVLIVKVLFKESEIYFLLNFISYLCSAVSSVGIYIVYPILFIFMAFQYFSIRERDEGLSLKGKIDEFDSL